MQQAGLSFISPLIAPDEGLEEYATSMALDDWSGEEETDPSAIKRLLVQVSPISESSTRVDHSTLDKILILTSVILEAIISLGSI